MKSNALPSSSAAAQDEVETEGGRAEACWCGRPNCPAGYTGLGCAFENGSDMPPADNDAKGSLKASLASIGCELRFALLDVAAAGATCSPLNMLENGSVGAAPMTAGRTAPVPATAVVLEFTAGAGDAAPIAGVESEPPMKSNWYPESLNPAD